MNQRRRKLTFHSSFIEEEEDDFEDVRAELRTTSFNLVSHFVKDVFGVVFMHCIYTAWLISDM